MFHYDVCSLKKQVGMQSRLDQRSYDNAAKQLSDDEVPGFSMFKGQDNSR
jgi:hypothetical protein